MSLIDKAFIRSRITTEAPWCKSHGAEHETGQLGAGILYYGLTHALQSKTCVCLGSGGGYVPRLMRQAQRDLEIKGSRTILVDGAHHIEPSKKAILGEPDWLLEDSFFRTNYPDIEIHLELTETAFHEYFQPNNVKIDFLHIDADHRYEGVKLDWDLFSTLLADTGIVTLHDTINHREPFGVHRLIEEIRAEDHYEMINLPIACGTAILRKR